MARLTAVVWQVRPWRKGRQRGLEITGLGGDGDEDDSEAGAERSFGWWPFGRASLDAGEEAGEVAAGGSAERV
jgi:hypothetical protein